MHKIQKLIIFIFSFVLVASCRNKSNYKQYFIDQTSIDSTKVLNSSEVRAFYYNYNVCKSDLSSILISQSYKLKKKKKNHIEK